MTTKTQAGPGATLKPPPDLSTWTPQPYPDNPKEAFAIINAWSKVMLEWETKVWAMCAIAELKFDISEEDFSQVLKKVKEGKHSKEDIAAALADAKKAAKQSGGAAPASDVVGHPPGPTIFDENTV